MANKSKLTWTNPTQNTDGTPYNASTENAGYDVALDGTVATVTLPFAFGTEFDMQVLAQYQALTAGTHDVRLRVVNKDGIYSDWAGPISFPKAGKPKVPSAIAVV